MNEKKENEDDETITKKVNYFLDSKAKIHIDLKNGFWYNGVIMEISSDFFMLKEARLGLMPVFFKEVKNIEPFSRDG